MKTRKINSARSSSPSPSFHTPKHVTRLRRSTKSTRNVAGGCGLKSARVLSRLLWTLSVASPARRNARLVGRPPRLSPRIMLLKVGAAISLRSKHWRALNLAPSIISSPSSSGHFMSLGLIVLRDVFRNFSRPMAPNLGKLATGVDAEADTCVLFTDGLRFDLGMLLQERLESRGIKTRLSHRIAPFPTVTATAKPLASPAHSACAGGSDAEDFYPLVSDNGKQANAARLRDAMARQGVEILEDGETSIAVGSEAGAWTELGKLESPRFQGHFRRRRCCDRSTGNWNPCGRTAARLPGTYSPTPVVGRTVATVLSRSSVSPFSAGCCFPAAYRRRRTMPTLPQPRPGHAMDRRRPCCHETGGLEHRQMGRYRWYWNPFWLHRSPHLTALRRSFRVNVE